MGHFSRDCPEPRTGGQICYNCKGTGIILFLIAGLTIDHLAKDCPNPRQRTGQNGTNGQRSGVSLVSISDFRIYCSTLGARYARTDTTVGRGRFRLELDLLRSID
jgi:hypothetical protein